jgi:hypothetical protein
MAFTDFITLDDIMADEDARFEFQHYLRLNDAEEIIAFVVDYEEFSTKSGLASKGEGPTVEELSLMLEDIVQRYIVDGAPQLLNTCPFHLLRITRALFLKEQTKGLLLSMENILTEMYSQLRTKHFPAWIKTEDFEIYFTNAGESVERVAQTPSPNSSDEPRRKSSISLDSSDLQILAAVGGINGKAPMQMATYVEEKEICDIKQRMDQKNAYLTMV